MVLDYQGFAYQAIYRYTLYQKDVCIGKYKDFKNAMCFSEIFGKLMTYSKLGENNFTGIYTIQCKKEFKKYAGNYCALNKEQILKVLRYMRKTFNISTYLQDLEDVYNIRFKVKGKTVKHKFVLTFSRVFFEFPFNECAAEVFRLRDLKTIDGIYYANKSFLELLHLIQMTYKSYNTTMHSLFAYPCVEINSKILNEAFTNDKERVDKVFQGDFDIKLKEPFKYYTTFYKLDWIDGINDRTSKYSDTFKILKHEKDIRRRAKQAL